MAAVGEERGFALRERGHGDTVSFELVKGTTKHFSIQISVRSVTLEEPVISA
jgi:hypothetical protein